MPARAADTPARERAEGLRRGCVVLPDGPSVCGLHGIPWPRLLRHEGQRHGPQALRSGRVLLVPRTDRAVFRSGSIETAGAQHPRIHAIRRRYISQPHGQIRIAGFPDTASTQSSGLQIEAHGSKRIVARPALKCDAPVALAPNSAHTPGVAGWLTSSVHCLLSLSTHFAEGISSANALIAKAWNACGTPYGTPSTSTALYGLLGLRSRTTRSGWSLGTTRSCATRGYTIILPGDASTGKYDVPCRSSNSQIRASESAGETSSRRSAHLLQRH